MRSQYSSLASTAGRVAYSARQSSPGVDEHRKGLRPVLVGVLLRVPARQVPHMLPAERDGAVVVLVGLAHRAEELFPLRVVVQPVGVVHHVPHLVAQVAEDVLAVPPFDVPGPLGVHLLELVVGQVEGDGDRHRLEGHPPLGGQVEPRGEPAEPSASELPAELRQDRLEARSLDGQAEVADRSRPDGRFPEAGGLEVWGSHGGPNLVASPRCTVRTDRNARPSKLS